MVISMKPNRTSMLLRSIYKDIGSSYRVTSEGFPTDEMSVAFPMPDPLKYSDAKLFAKDYFIYNLARKRELKNPTSTQMRTSLGKWAESERRCHVVNQCGRWVEPITEDERVRFNRLDQSVRRIINSVLVDQWPELDFSPTGGATATVKRKYSLSVSKVDGTPLTENLQPHKCAPASRVYLELMLHNNPGVARRFLRARHQLLDESQSLHPIELPHPTDEEIRELAIWLCTDVPPASFDFVPKDINTVRLIAKSNSISIMVQKTFGDAIRRALMNVGINLNDQTVNQEWAEIGSLTGLVATVDLSAASDSISRYMVNFLPRRWQAYVNASRDTHVSCGRTSYKLAMLAGMGNGYIFELESLLFYAMTRAVVEELKLDTSMISVYGDDIICPIGAVDLLSEYMLSLGFLFNKEKSFSKGLFRESCGKHYFNGVDVTPVYIKSDLDNTEELYHCYNGLSEWSRRTGVSLSNCLTQIANCIPIKERCLVPITWDTKSGLHYPCEGALLPVRKWNSNWQRYEFVWSILTPKTSFNVYDMLPRWTAITQHLIQAESLEDVCDSKFFLRAFSHFKFNNPSSTLWHPHGSIRNVKDTVVTWSEKPQYTRTKHRDVSLEGDA